jgi:hypothetical protein
MTNIKIRGSSETYSPKYDWSEYFVEIRFRRDKYEFYFESPERGYLTARKDTLLDAEIFAYSLRLKFESCNGLHDWKSSHDNNPKSKFGECQKCHVSQNNVFEPEAKCSICNSVAYFNLSVDISSNDVNYCSKHYFEKLNKIITPEKDELFCSSNESDYNEKSYYNYIKKDLEFYKSGVLLGKSESDLDLFLNDNSGRVLRFIHNYVILTLSVDSLRNGHLWHIESKIQPVFTKELINLYLKEIKLLNDEIKIDVKKLNSVILNSHNESLKREL